MIAVFIGGGILLVAALAAAIWARVRLWGARLGPEVASSTPPSGPLILASASERGRYMEFVPMLADWQVRDVVRSESVGPYLPQSFEHKRSVGREWHFTAGERIAQVHPIETIVLAAMFGGEPHPGDRIVLERDDVDWRVRVSDAVVEAIRVQRSLFGEERPRAPWMRALIVAAAVLGAVGLVLGAAGAGTGTAVLAWAIVGSIVLAGVAVVIALLPAKSAAERDYLQGVRNLRAWVHTTAEPDLALAGWAMIWNLPGAWATAVPESVARLSMVDRSFVRGDYRPARPATF